MGRSQPGQFGDYLIKAVFALIVSIPLVGFVHGVVYCEACGGNIVNRVIVGAVQAIMTTINVGLLPADKEGTVVYNLWPYIFGSTVMIMLVYLVARKVWEKKTSLH